MSPVPRTVRGRLQPGAAPVLSHRACGVPLSGVRQGVQLPGQPGEPPTMAQATARQGAGWARRAGLGKARRHGRRRRAAVPVSSVSEEVPAPGLPKEAPGQSPAGRRGGDAPHGAPGRRAGRQLTSAAHGHPLANATAPCAPATDPLLATWPALEVRWLDLDLTNASVRLWTLSRYCKFLSFGLVTSWSNEL